MPSGSEAMLRLRGEYLSDGALTMEYAACDFVGRQTFLRRDGSARLVRIAPGGEFQAARQVPSATLVARRAACTERVLAAALASRVFTRPSNEILAIDRFNYVQDAHVVHGAAPALDERLIAEVEA